MKVKQPLVSVITVVKNGEKYLQQTISSVTEQDFSSKEYIVIDGGSTDKTIEIIKKNEEKIDKWVSGPDEGIFDGMNRGLKLSEGEWIWFINSDDFLENGILSTIFSDYRNKMKGKDIVYGNIRRLGRGYDYIVKERNLKNNENIIDFSHPATLVRRSALDQAGLFNSRYKLIADYELFCRLSKTGAEDIYIDELFSSMREGGASSKISNTLKRMVERISVDRIHFGLGTAAKTLLFYLIPGFFKKVSIAFLTVLGMEKIVAEYYKRKY